MTASKRGASAPLSSEEKARNLQKWLEQHAEMVAHIKAG